MPSDEYKRNTGSNKRITSDDLIKFGLIPELIGRLPIIATLNELSIDILRDILVLPKDSLVSQYHKMLKLDGVELTFESEAIMEIAKMAYEKGTGARSLRAVMEEYLLEIMYMLPDDTIEEIIITPGYIRGEGGTNYKT